MYVCLCVRVCVEHVYRQRQLAGVSSLCTASWVWTSVLRLGHKSLNSQPLAGSDFGFWKVLTWLLGPVIWFVQSMFILVRRICIGLMLNGRCFLELWVLFDDLCTGENRAPAAFSPFWPVALSVFRTAVASSGLTFSCINPLQLSLTSPLGLFLSAKRSLLLGLFRVPSVWNILLRPVTAVSFPLQAEGGALALVCFSHLVTVCVCAWGVSSTSLR